MHLSNLELWTWYIGFACYLLLMTVLVVKKRYRAFPWFTALLGFEILETITLYCVHRFLSAHAYAYTYWTAELLESLIRIGVMVEIALITSRLMKLPKNSHLKLVLTGLVAATALSIGFVVHHHSVGTWLSNLAIKTSICTALLGGLLVFTFVAATFFEGVRIRIHSQAIAYGTFLYFSGKMLLMLVLLIGADGWWRSLQDYLKPMYIVCLVIWAVMFLFDQPERVLTTEMDGLQRLVERAEGVYGKKRTTTALPAPATSLFEPTHAMLTTGPLPNVRFLPAREKKLELEPEPQLLCS